MTFLQKMKDKKFRFKVIVITLLIFFVINTFSADKKETRQPQAVCDEYNTFNTFIATTTDLQSCTATGCFVQHQINPTSILGNFLTYIGWTTHIFHLDVSNVKCVPGVQTGKWVMATSKGAAGRMCMSDTASNMVHNTLWSDDDVYMCVSGDPTQRCNSAEKGISDILTSIWPDAPGGCKTQYYMVLGIGGMMAFMMMGMIL